MKGKITFLILFLFFSINIFAQNNERIDSRINNLIYNQTTNAIEFDLEFKAGTNYISENSTSGQWGFTNIRWEIYLETGVTISTENAIVTGNDSYINNTAFQTDYPTNSSISETPSKVLFATTLRRDLPFTTNDIETEYVHISSYSIPVTSDTKPTNLSYIVQLADPTIFGSSWTITRNSQRKNITPDLQKYYLAECPDLSEEILLSGDREICNGTTTTIIASAPGINSPTFRWYTAATGGTAFHTGIDYTTPSLVKDTIFYVSIQTEDYCAGKEDKNRKPVIIKLIPNVSTSSDIEISGTQILCTNESTVLKAETVTTTPEIENPVFYWYNSPIGGIPFFTGAEYTTPILTADTTFYVSVEGDNYCEGTDRKSVNIKVLPFANASDINISGITTICSGNTTTLNATSTGIINPVYRWYNSSVDGIPFYIGTDYTTAELTEDTTFYVTVEGNNYCEGTDRKHVSIEVLPLSTASDISISGITTICSGNATTLKATSTGVINPVYRWYSSSTSGTLLYIGAEYTTLILTENTVLYVTVEGDNFCEGTNRKPVNIEVLPISNASDITISGITTICPGNTTILKSTSTGITNPVYSWYSSSTGEVPFYTGDEYNTTKLASDTTLYVTVEGDNYCEGTDRKPVNIEVLPLSNASDITISGTTNICSGNTTTLKASSAGIINPVYRWYNSSTGGAPFYRGDEYTATELTENTTLYVTVEGDNYCEGTDRKHVNIEVLPLAIASDITISGATTICSGNTTSLKSSSSVITNPVYRWYNSSNGEIPFYTGEEYTTAELISNTTLYVTVEGDNYCEGTDRKPVSIEVLPFTNASDITISGITTICSGNTTSLKASSSGITNPVYRWYNSPTGGIPLYTGSEYTTQPLTRNTVLYVTVEGDNYCEGIDRELINIEVLPFANVSDITISGTTTICSGNITTLQASSTGIINPVYRWYNSPIGGTPIYTGSEYTTPILTNNTVLYVTVEGGNYCEGTDRKAVNIEVLPLSSATDISISGITTICSGNTTTLKATSTAIINPVYRWYNSPTGGIPFYTGEEYTTAELIEDTILYVTVEGDNYCEGTNRKTVSIEVLPLSNASDITIIGITNICLGKTTTLKASSAGIVNPIYHWYGSSTGTPFYTGEEYTTSELTEDTTLFVTVEGDNYCEGIDSKAVNIEVLPLSNAADISISGITTICSGNTTTLKASSAGIINPVYRWYNFSIGGVPLYTGSEYTMPTLTSNTVLYVTVEGDNYCEGTNRKPVNIEVLPLSNASDITISGITTICSENTTTLKASSAGIINPVYRWYNSSIGGVLLYTGSEYTTPILTSNTVLYATVSGNNYCEGSERKPVNIEVLPLADVSVITISGETTVCSGSAATLEASSAGIINPVYNWYYSLSAEIPFYTGVECTTPILTNNTVLYVSVKGDNYCESIKRKSVSIKVLPTSNASAISISGTTTICSGNTTTLKAVAAGIINPVYRWYSSLSEEIPFHTGVDYTTSELTADTVLYVTVSGNNYCEGTERKSVSIKVLPLADVSVITISGETTICSGSTTILKTTSASVTNPVYRWYNSLTAETPFYTGVEYTTSELIADTTLYITVLGNNYCEGSERKPVSIEVLPLADVSVISISGETTVCSGSFTTLKATSTSITNPVYRWYSSSTAGVLLHTDEEYTTPKLITDTSFYVTVTGDNYCEGTERKSINIEVIPSSNASDINISGETIICSGNTTTLKGAATEIINPVYRWYSSLTAETPFYTGFEYTTSKLVTDTILYITVSGDNYCEGIERKSVSIEILPSSDSSTINISGETIVCSGNTTTLQASSQGIMNPIYRWYSSLTSEVPVYSGIEYNTPELIADTVLYVTVSGDNYCEGVERKIVSIKVLPLSDASAISINSETTICSGNTTTLQASSIGITNPTYRWYHSSEEETALHIGSEYTTPTLTGNTVLYVTVSGDNYCEGIERKSVNIEVLPPSNALDINISGTTTICSGNTTTLEASSQRIINPVYRWYNSLTTNNPFYIGSEYATPELIADTTLYVTVSGDNYCEGTERKSVSIEVLRISNASDVSISGDTTICTENTTILEATSTEIINPVYHWYGSSTGGTAFYTGSEYTTSILTKDTILYIMVTGDNHCEGVERKPVSIKVLPLSDASAINISGDTILSSGTAATLQASSTGIISPIYRWYSSLSSEAPSYTGAKYTTPELTSDTILYVTVLGNNYCEGSRRSVKIIVTPPSGITNTPEDKSIMINVFPNPTNHSSTVSIELNDEFKGRNISKIELYDVQGRLVKVQKGSSNLVKIETPHTSGNYVIRIYIGNSQIVNKHLIVK